MLRSRRVLGHDGLLLCVLMSRTQKSIGAIYARRVDDEAVYSRARFCVASGILVSVASFLWSVSTFDDGVVCSCDGRSEGASTQEIEMEHAPA